MNKPEMILVCVKPYVTDESLSTTPFHKFYERKMAGITPGKAYVVHSIAEHRMQVCVIDNYGEPCWYPVNLFNTREGWRETKLNEIGIL